MFWYCECSWSELMLTLFSHVCFPIIYIRPFYRQHIFQFYLKSTRDSYRHILKTLLFCLIGYITFSIGGNEVKSYIKILKGKAYRGNFNGIALRRSTWMLWLGVNSQLTEAVNWKGKYEVSSMKDKWYVQAGTPNFYLTEKHYWKFIQLIYSFSIASMKPISVNKEKGHEQSKAISDRKCGNVWLNQIRFKINNFWKFKGNVFSISDHNIRKKKYLL